MKLLKSILMFITFGLIVPISVFAEGNDYAKLDTVEVASKGDEISVNIVVVSEKEINEFKSTFTYETGVLEFLNIESKNDGWKMVSDFSKESPLTLQFNHENGLMGESTVATLKFKIKEDSTKTETIISLEGATKIKEDETIVTLEKVSKTIAVKSKDNSLSDIKFNGETINNFSSKQYEYSFITKDPSVTTANFEATLNDKTATFKEGFAPKTGAPLDYGENKFEIVVVSAYGEEKKYTITVIREDNRGTNNYLKKLLVNSREVQNFKRDSLLYSITTHKQETLDIVAEPEDIKATVKIDKPEKLAIGNNKILITVISENKEEKVYTLTVNNLDRDIDTTLSDIELFGCDESINFEKDKYDYEVMYKSKYKESLVIKPVLSNDEEAVASIKKDLSNLKAGDKVTITVSAKDGTQNVENYYTILFKKDNRINFFLILSLIIFIVLLVTFIKLLISRKKKQTQVVSVEPEIELEKTKRLEKINLE